MNINNYRDFRVCVRNWDSYSEAEQNELKDWYKKYYKANQEQERQRYKDYYSANTEKERNRISKNRR